MRVSILPISLIHINKRKILTLLLPNTLSLLKLEMDRSIQVCSLQAITLQSYRNICIAFCISERT